MSLHTISVPPERVARLLIESQDWMTGGEEDAEHVKGKIQSSVMVPCIIWMESNNVVSGMYDEKTVLLQR